MPEDASLELGRLLVVDDEVDFAQYLGNVATLEGYEVRLVRNLTQFAAELDEFRPNIVIMDMVMPDTDGFEILRLLAARRSRARVVIVSGYTPLYLGCAVKMAEGLGLESIIALQKPVKLKDLRSVLAAERPKPYSEAEAHGRFAEASRASAE